MIRINLIKSIPENIHIKLEENFRKKLFEEISKTYTKVDLHKKFGWSNQSYTDWYIGRRNPSLKAIYEIISLLKINKTELFNNIKSLTSYYNAGSIRLKTNEINFDEEFAEWFGFVKGDGCIHKKYVDGSNTKLSLVLQFVEFLEKRFGVNKSQLEVTLVVPSEGKKNDFEKIIDYFRKKGFEKIIIRKLNEKRKRRKLLFRIRFNSRLLAIIMSRINNKLYSILVKSPNKVKCAFIRGYCAAEGSVGDRRVDIGQKNYEELIFIKKLLLSLGFKHVGGPDLLRKDFYRIAIYTKKELEKFRDEINFGRNKERNEKLDILIGKYKFDYSWHKTKKERYKEILNIIKKSGRTTAPSIKKRIKAGYKHTSYLLKEMLDLGLIKVNKKRKPYLYYVG